MTSYLAQSIVIYIYLSVPPLLMLLRSVWSGLLDKTVPWPKGKAVLLVRQCYVHILLFYTLSHPVLVLVRH